MVCGHGKGGAELIWKPMAMSQAQATCLLTIYSKQTGQHVPVGKTGNSVSHSCHPPFSILGDRGADASEV